MIRNYAILLIIALLVLSGCSIQDGISDVNDTDLNDSDLIDIDVNDTIEEPEDIEFTFESSECNTSIDPYNESNLGITKTIWFGEDILEIEAHVSINCAEEILGGDYEIDESKIILEYNHTSCTVCTTCNCVHNLTYKFENIAKKEYEFVIE
jgi:hypothetical protein